MAILANALSSKWCGDAGTLPEWPTARFNLRWPRHVTGARPSERRESAEQATKLAATGLRTVLKFRVPRTNITLSETIDQAIEMVGAHNRCYAEALLRIHAVKTPVIMGVLFDVARRRSIGSPTIPLAPARGIRLLHSVRSKLPTTGRDSNRSATRQSLPFRVAS